MIPTTRPGSYGWPRLIAAAIALCAALYGCSSKPTAQVGPDPRAQDMATEAAGWNEAIAGWRRELADWRRIDAVPAASGSASLKLRTARIDDQMRRIEAFATTLETHSERLRMVLGTGSRPPIALSSSVSDEHLEMKSTFHLLAASELSLDDEHQP